MHLATQLAADLQRQLAQAEEVKADEATNNGLGRQLKRWVRHDTPSESAAAQEQKALLDAAQRQGGLAPALLASTSRVLQDAVKPP